MVYIIQKLKKGYRWKKSLLNLDVCDIINVIYVQFIAKAKKSAPACWDTYFVRSKHSRKKYVSHVELLNKRIRNEIKNSMGEFL